MEVVDVYLPVDGVPAEVIGRAMNVPPLHPAARHAERIAVGMMLTPISALAGGCSAELSTPDHQSLLKQAALLQVCYEASDGTIGGGGVLAMALLQLSMLVPIKSISLAALHLDKTDPPIFLCRLLL